MARIEAEIQQKRFRSEHEKLIVNMYFTNSVITSVLLDFLKPYDLSVQQYNVLRILRGQYPDSVNIGSISDRMLDKMSNASRLVEKLRLKELITRCENSADRRQVDIKISEKGLAALDELDKNWLTVEKKFDTFNEQQAELLNALLDRLRGTIN